MTKSRVKESSVVETRLIKSTSKRQVTIPKSFFNILSLEQGVTFVAQLFDEGIFLVPQIRSEQSIWDEDRKAIIRQVMREKLNGEELVEELNFRLKKYDEFLVKKIEGFEAEILEEEKDLDDTLGVVNFNGLEILFNPEIEASSKEP